MWGTYLKQMVNKYIMLQFMVGSLRGLLAAIYALDKHVFYFITIYLYWVNQLQ